MYSIASIHDSDAVAYGHQNKEDCEEGRNFLHKAALFMLFATHDFVRILVGVSHLLSRK